MPFLEYFTGNSIAIFLAGKGLFIVCNHAI